MKTQIFSKRNAPISIIGFLLLMATTSLGCAILSNAYPVTSLHPILLTQDDLRMMQVTSIRHLNMPLKEPSVIEVSVQ
ncbi:MAG: hypothetical protein OXI63_06490 [Candidatus Poribacteria bacterium]|nr:hypothetical protein [Candidatus Poribacteria bacterium]